jgi:phosphoesterase RecJ-like protein
MVTDSGRFRFREVSGETMRLAGSMLEQGIDTDTLYANLYMKDFESLKFEGYIYKKIKISLDPSKKEEKEISGKGTGIRINF